MSTRFSALMIVLLFLFALAGPIAAQEVTPDAPTDTSIVVNDGGTLVLDQSPALPAEITETLPDRGESLTTVVIVVGGLAVALVLSLFLAVLFLAYQHMPPWGQSLLMNNRGWIEAKVDRGTDLVVDAARLTKNTFDDVAAAYIDEKVDAGIKAWFDARAIEMPLRE